MFREKSERQFDTLRNLHFAKLSERNISLCRCSFWFQALTNDISVGKNIQNIRYLLLSILVPAKVDS